MVGVTVNWSNDPISAAHAAIQESKGDVAAVLQQASIPPREAIPLVGDPAAKTGSWARYIGMVQDVWDAELFAALTSDARSALFVEDAAAGNAANPSLAERLPVYLVSLPGETGWVRATRASASRSSAQPMMQSGRLKRGRDEVDDDVMEEGEPVVAASVRPAAGAASASGAGAGSSVGAGNAQEKRQRPGGFEEVPQTKFHGMGLNLPIPTQIGGSAIVAKLYDNISGNNLKINSVVEVVGIMQDPLEVGAANENEGDLFAAEFAARNPTNVQRLHAVRVRQVEEWEINPTTERIGRTQGLSGLGAARKELLGVLPGLRQRIIEYLGSVLYDDMLAAEYLLMCLLSRPGQRTGAGGVLGKLCVNVVFPKEAREDSELMKNVIGAIERLVPSLVHVDVNIGALNSMDLLPKKDYTANRLKAGRLQLATGSVLLGDESSLSDGQLSERGVKNVRALAAVSQKLVTPIDFQYYEAEVPVHCSAVLVSIEGKSIVPCDVVVRICGGKKEVERWKRYDEEEVGRMRLAIGLLLENGEFDISEEAVQAVEGEYVRARKRGEAKEGQETLQSWLAVARMCARSFGEGELSGERWRYCMALEGRRVGRV